MELTFNYLPCGAKGSWLDPTFNLAPQAWARVANSDREPTRVVLGGVGTAVVYRQGAGTTTCGGAPQMVLEASKKPFSLEPSITFAWAGGRGDGSFSTPCFLGHWHQPVWADVTGTFAGAWTAAHNWGTFRYRLDVSAPDAQGFRHVSYDYLGLDGSHDTFQGDLHELD